MNWYGKEKEENISNITLSDTHLKCIMTYNDTYNNLLMFNNFSLKLYVNLHFFATEIHYQSTSTCGLSKCENAPLDIQYVLENK